MTEMAEIEQAALRLPIDQRVCLTQSLLDSLSLPSDSSEAGEIEEAGRREREIETGRVQPLDEKELWRRLEIERRP